MKLAAGEARILIPATFCLYLNSSSDSLMDTSKANLLAAKAMRCELRYFCKLLHRSPRWLVYSSSILWRAIRADGWKRHGRQQQSLKRGARNTHTHIDTRSCSYHKLEVATERSTNMKNEMSRFLPSDNKHL